VLLEGAPNEVIGSLHGKIWSKVVATDEELHVIEGQYHVISSHLVGGQHELRIYADTSPGDGFQAVDSDLEDVYFLNLSELAKRQNPN
jgi:ABC-2 type transport system ATP-binding protein